MVYGWVGVSGVYVEDQLVEGIEVVVDHSKRQAVVTMSHETSLHASNSEQ